MLQTEFEFTLPKGYVDQQGTLHKHGVMRLATARDEIQPQRDPRVKDNEAYLTIIMLSRVITELGEVRQINPSVIEGLFAADLAYLQDFYSIINFGDPSVLDASNDPTAETNVEDQVDQHLNGTAGDHPDPFAPAGPGGS